MEVPRTPNRSTSEGPCPPTRNSMEDADSSVTRKRPRLDSGERAYRSMSADGTLPPRAGPTQEELLPNTSGDAQEQEPALALDNTAHHSLHGTPSKVTINVRDRILDSSSPPHSMATIEVLESYDTTQPSRPASSINMSSTPPGIVTVSSSPAQSPEIEVAEIEDMDDDPRQTRWKPMVSITSMEDLQTELLDSFPLASRYHDPRQAVAYLAQAFEKGDTHGGELLKHLTDWIEKYLEQTEQYSSEWWNMFADAREFWDELPLIMEGFLRRSIRFDDAFATVGGADQDRANFQFIIEFSSAFVALTARMVQVDCQTLEDHAENPSVPPDLISPPYLTKFAWLPLPNKQLPLWKILHDFYQYDSTPVVVAAVRRFTQPPVNGLQGLSRYIELVLDQSPSQPGLLTNVWQPLKLTNLLTSYSLNLQESDSDIARDLVPYTASVIPEAFRVFSVVETKLQTFVTKQISTLSLEFCKGIVGELCQLLRNIMYADERLAALHYPENCPSSEGLSKMDRCFLIEVAWKYRVLERCIRQGRMEIRVQGVDSLQGELLDVFGKYIKENPKGAQQPIVKYLAHLILEDKLVDYLVGVESHPQLIVRSGNIVGFLIVAGKYTEAESDVIWKTVASSQDTRTIDAILTMIEGVFNIADYDIFLYLCKQLNDLPIRSFDGRMTAYCGTLLRCLRNSLVKKSLDKLDMLPYHLCIRLIRQASADVSLSSNRKQEIYQYASLELQNLLELGPSDADRDSIYRQCIEDISTRSPFATGSIAAVNALLQRSPRKDIEILATTSNITSLMVSDLASVTRSQPTNAVNSDNYNDPFTVRLSLLEQIIKHIPDSITPDLGESLWKSMFAAPASSEQTRDTAWTTLENAARSSRTRNSFLTQCIRTYLPQADPQCLTSAVLPFAEQFIDYEIRTSLYKDTTGVKEFNVPGSELLWHISLSAPQQVIGEKAIQMLVSQYMGGPTVRRAAQDVVQETHIKMVEQCIRQLIKAASRLRKLNDGTSSGEEDSMVIVAAEGEVQKEKLYFVRSLSILKEIMKWTRSRVMLPSPSPKLLQRESNCLKGEKICIKYQPFNGGSNKGQQAIEVGDLETYRDLSDHLVKLTGFSQFSAIAGGQRLDPTTCGEMSLRDMKLEQKGLLLIRKCPDATCVQDSNPRKALRPLEIEVMNHFQELYDLLGIDEPLGKDVFDFLITFEPHKTIVNMVCSENTSLASLFPPEVPYKGLYSVYALKTALSNQLQDGTASQELILHGVHITVAALAALGAPDFSWTEITPAKGIVDCLLNFLKEPVPSDISAIYFTNPSKLIDRLHQLIDVTQSITPTPEIILLIQNSFATMLEASLHSRPVWNYFKSNEKSSKTLQSLLLKNPNRAIRDGVATAMKSVCGALPTPTETKSREFVSYFWENIIAMIPRTFQHSQNAEQFFNIALEIFRSMDEDMRDVLPLATYIKDWSNLLLMREHNEFVGRDHVDWILFGLASLLDWCIQLMKSTKKPLNINGDLLQKIFQTHLFPEISSGTSSTTPADPIIPVLHSPTRAKLYSILLALSGDFVGYEKLLDLATDLLPQEEYHYEANWNFERLKVIRSPTGFPGMKNLSNTCYLNSLFTQLFMNVGFRGFMLKTDVVDGEASQKLLSETKRLFSYMQETWFRAVDPQGIADSGINYENSPIDVSVQMDVEEFYNLLFAKWESQILSKSAKEAFTRFYGGKIVQQIHAEPCGHVSERVEPFSAIQCEIQGKASLVESLSAYIGGEAMEGDNKYACQGCGSYRNAMKRACFKDVPDNLIFHLKRFEYDVATGMRSKINDKFDFPEHIDMTPYNVEYLKDSKQPIAPDVFNLVGILVHSGTTDSGHYYSYIRERPVNPAQTDTWLEFNDADVNRFDPSHIPDQCFGGWSDGFHSQIRYPKPWNAYMLFYQRASSMEAEQQKFAPIVWGIPVKEVVSDEIRQQIAVENTTWIRKFCLFDPEHARFAKSLLEQLRDLSKNTCSEDHGLEKKVLWLSLEHLDQILSREKDCHEFDSVLRLITERVGNCSECCKATLDWVSQHESALRNLLLRNPDQMARVKFSALVIGALRYLRDRDPRLYGFDIDVLDYDPSIDHVPEVSGGAFQGIVERLKEMWLYIHLHSKAWDEYFGLLQTLAGFGRVEAYVMLREGVLKQCLELLVIDHANAKKLRTDMPHYAHYFRLSEKGRKFSTYNLAGLVDSLLKWIDLGNTIDRLDGDRILANHRYPLAKYEESLMNVGYDPFRSKALAFLDKILAQSGNIDAGRSIVRAIVRAENSLGMLSMVIKTILGGVNIEPADMAESYLHAALAVCEVCPNHQDIRDLVYRISHEVETIGQSGGEQHLFFFSQARRIRNERLARKHPHYLHSLVLGCVPQWAPTLLMYPDDQVRQDTIGLLQTLVFNQDVEHMDDEQRADELIAIGKNLSRACLQRMTDLIIKPGKTVDVKIVEETVKVVRHCVEKYYTADAEEDSMLVQEAELILEHLSALTVSTPDDALSDTWDNGSDLPTDSESELVFLSS